MEPVNPAKGSPIPGTIALAAAMLAGVAVAWSRLPRARYLGLI